MSDKTKDDTVIDRILEVMNRAINADSEAVASLCDQRVPCNETLAKDLTIQVGTYHGHPYTVGLIGILAGIAGSHEDGYSKICAIFETVCETHGVVDEAAENKCPVDGCEKTVRLGHILEFKRTRYETAE